MFHLSWLPTQARALQVELPGGHGCSGLSEPSFQVVITEEGFRGRVLPPPEECDYLNKILIGSTWIMCTREMGYSF